MPLRMKALSWRLLQKLGPPSRTKRNEALPLRDRTQLGLRSCKKLGNERAPVSHRRCVRVDVSVRRCKDGKVGQKELRKTQEVSFCATWNLSERSKKVHQIQSKL